MIEDIHYNKNIEKAILGTIISTPDAITKVYHRLTPEMFYLDDHQLIYRAIQRMYGRNQTIDLLTVSHFMGSDKIELTTGNAAFVLTELSRKAVSENHIESHALIITEMWKARKVIGLTGGMELTGDINEVIKKKIAEYSELLEITYSREWHDREDLAMDIITHQDAIANGSKKFVTTGFSKIDRINSGFSGGDMVVIGARPSVGKSALMLMMAEEMGKRGNKVGIISLEMNNTQVMARLASLNTGIDFRKIYHNLFDDEHQRGDFLKKIQHPDFLKIPIFLSDKTSVDITDIKAKALKLKKSRGCDILMIDYLQLVDSTDTRGNREQEVARISRGIKLMAMEMNIPVVVLVQLNREVTKRSNGDRFPRLSDIRESGSLEQDADVVMMLHRDWTTGMTTDPTTGRTTEFEADLTIAKWRNGEVGKFPLDFEPRQMKFSESNRTYIKIGDTNRQEDDSNPF